MGTAYYDNTGRLVRLQRNKYSQDLLTGLSQGRYNITTKERAFFNGPSQYPFTSYNNQLKPYRYALNSNISSELSVNEPKPLYHDGLTYIYYNPYLDFYKPNIEPRLNMLIPDLRYKLYYGGTSLLSSQEDYVFYDLETQSGGLPDERIFTDQLTNRKYMLTTTNYLYNNPSRFTPTTIETTDMHGNKYREEIKVVMDSITDKNSTIDSLRARHMLYSPLKSTKLAKSVGENDFRIVSETVTEYKDTLLGSNRYYVNNCSHELMLTDPVSVSAANLNKRFSCPSSSYSLENRFTHTRIGEKVVVTQHNTPGTQKSYIYDPELERQILSAENTPLSSLAAFDRCRALELANTSVSSSGMATPDDLRKFLEIHDQYAPTNTLRDSFLVRQLNSQMLEAAEYILSGRIYTQDVTQGGGRRGDIVNQYEDLWYRQSAKIPMSLNNYMDFIEKVIKVISLAAVDPDKLPLILNKDKLGNSISGRLQVKNATGRKYNYIIVSPRQKSSSNCTVSYTVTYADGSEENGSKTFVIPAGKSVVCWGEIELRDIPAGQNTPQVEVSTGNTKMVCGVLFPHGSDFTMNSYNSKGDLYCRIHPGGMESYEYDNAGRLLRVFDKYGNIIEEYHRHLVIE